MECWLMLASHLHMSLQKVQSETTATELIMWVEYLIMERRRVLETQDKSDLQTAIIAAEVRRSWVKHPGKVQISDFLQKPKSKPKPLPASRSDRVRAIKRRFLSALGVSEENS